MKDYGRDHIKDYSGYNEAIGKCVKCGAKVKGKYRLCKKCRKEAR